jgi:hypothetical protein
MFDILGSRMLGACDAPHDTAVVLDIPSSAVARSWLCPAAIPCVVGAVSCVGAEFVVVAWLHVVFHDCGLDLVLFGAAWGVGPRDWADVVGTEEEGLAADDLLALFSISFFSVASSFFIAVK